MNGTIISIGIHGTTERVGWSFVLLDTDGFIEERFGVSSTDLRAVLWAILHSISGVSPSEPIAIRTLDRLVLKVGEQWLAQWKGSGLEGEANAELIRWVIETVSNRNIKWFMVDSFPEPIDKRARELAKSSYQDPSCSLCEEDVSFILEQYQSPTTSKTKATSQTESDVEVHSDEQPDPKAEEATLTPVDLPIASEYLFGARILIYVDGLTAGHLGCWSFVLVDRQSQLAMMCAHGQRHTTHQRIKLQGCIEAFQALRSKDLSIEVRSRHQDIIQLGQRWMWDWKERGWKKKGNKTIQELPYVQQLHEVVSKHRVSWKHIPSEADEKGITDGFQLVQTALNQINEGKLQLLQHRLAKYPVDQLL